jgi:MFS family permease
LGLGVCKADYSSLPPLARHCSQGVINLPLVVGRALIGFGVAGALIAGLKAIVSWFPKERILLFNGCFIMLGTLGAICATSPAAWLLAYIGWRGLLDVMAGVTAATALIIFFVVPDSPPSVPNVASNSSVAKIIRRWVSNHRTIAVSRPTLLGEG